jgi:sulfonate transport system ATP-binding protein
VKPDLLVLDEPFVSLDAKLAVRLRAELVALVSRQPVTTLLVTHSIEEAIGLADRIVLLSPSPAHVLSDMRIECPRSIHSPEWIAAIRSEISQTFDVVPNMPPATKTNRQ